jgi:hypothetical protein
MVAMYELKMKVRLIFETGRRLLNMSFVVFVVLLDWCR